MSAKMVAKRYEELVATVKKHIALTDAEKEEHEAKFKSIAGTDMLISMSEYRAYAEKVIEQRKPALNAESQREEVDHMVERMAAKDENADRQISLQEFLNAQLFFKIEDTFASKNTDGDASKISDAELLEWLREWTIRDADLIAMKEGLISEEETELTTESLTEAMYRTMVPDSRLILDRFFVACRQAYKLDDNLKATCYRRFNDRSRGQDFVPVSAFKEMHMNMMKATLGDSADRRFARMVNTGMFSNAARARKAMKGLDPNNDGKVSRREYERSYCVVKMIQALAQYDENRDGSINQYELKAWLERGCGLRDDVEGYCNAIMKKFNATESKQLKKFDFVLDLSERVFPSDYQLATEVGKAIREVFALNDDELAEETKKFKAMAGEAAYILTDDFKDNVKEYVESKFPGAAAEEIGEIVESLKGQEDDGKVSLHDFCRGRIGRKFAASFTKGCGEDGLLDMDELNQWLRSELKMRKMVGQTTTALRYMFMPDVNCSASPPGVFIKGLFAMAFPPTKELLQTVVDEVEDRFAPSEDEEKTMRINLTRLSQLAARGNPRSFKPGSTTVSDYQKFIAAEVDQDDKIPSEMKAAIKKALLDAATKHDENNDNMISSEEFVRGEIYRKLLCSLHSVNSDGDLIMDKPELVVWLKATLDLADECYTEAVLETFLPKDAVELPIDVLLGGLMAEAFPSDERRVKDFISAFRLKCGIPDTPEDVKGEQLTSMRKALDRLASSSGRGFNSRTRGYPSSQSDHLSEWIATTVDSISDTEETAKALISYCGDINPVPVGRGISFGVLARVIESEVINNGENAVRRKQMQNGRQFGRPTNAPNGCCDWD